jgi:AraC-like DNA-binding protein
MLEMKPPQSSLSEYMLHWDVVQKLEVSRAMRVRSRDVENVRITEISGGACYGRRGERHRERDKGDFIALVCNFEGHEFCSSAKKEMVVKEGDIMLWRNRGDLTFKVDEWSRQLILLVPASRMEASLRRPLARDQVHLPGNSGLGLLVPQFMSALCQNFDRLGDREAEIAVEMALDLVGLRIDGETIEGASDRTTLYERILRHMDRCLQDADLSPESIAKAHSISRRYLHLIFAQHGQTVSGWIRERRLLRCREELDRAGRKLSVTEIAYRWGYSDSAHFSRSFRQRFGIPPGRWRDRHNDIQ